MNKNNIIEGKTLRECIMENGKWTMEEVLCRFCPVMETLEQMHRSNVFHREITPDNIMVLSDGSLILLSSAAETQYDDSSLTRLVESSVYAPPEKMDAKGVYGSWSDVYSICATMYFCITGVDPEDAISRLMLDELKEPSENGACIVPTAEKALMKGMELESSGRIRDMEQLRSELTNKN